jgi:hypothetical protein
VNLGHGDILSDQGVVRRTNASLLAKFSPDKPDHDYGLDGFFVWPSGEVWFSTEEGFNDKVLGPITDGDLLSDQGYVVFPNLELVQWFQPQDKLTNYGLRSLFVITDARPALPAPTLTVQLASTNLVSLSWTGKGRCFQVEAASAANGPFATVGMGISMTNTSTFGRMLSPGFYRLRQW